MPDDELPYIILAPRQIPGPPVLVAAAADADTAQVIARALEKAAGRPKDSYLVKVRR